jgi:hypothetical protein
MHTKKRYKRVSQFEVDASSNGKDFSNDKNDTVSQHISCHRMCKPTETFALGFAGDLAERFF